jgi:hypothetical protein
MGRARIAQYSIQPEYLNSNTKIASGIPLWYDSIEIIIIFALAGNCAVPIESGRA